ncbi:MAG: class I SAM-dependent methyltransferase [Chloroflexi bacterium]|nr:class I SAM-dependent methyltransferase [Chloroflexota bacterium]MCC6896619.1 class I SAM-dependent methyltransferase [Anaerolineae bacterium]
MTNQVLQDQIAYYRARAGEYDEWFYRVGRYDWGAERNAQWFAEAETVYQALHQAGKVESALELAAGTGNFTKELVKIADHVTALDASDEVIAINRTKTSPPDPLSARSEGEKRASVTYQQADLFNWQPTEQYDLVFMSFWLSHVPPEKLDTFLQAVRQATRPGGKVFMVDSLRDQTRTSTASNHAEYDPESIYHTRKLNDGQEYTIVKVFYDEALVAKLAEHGFTASYHTSGDYFWWAVGERLRG